MTKRMSFMALLLLVFSLALVACGGAATEAPPAEQPTEAPSVEEPTEAPAVEEPTEAPVVEEPSEERVQIRWFVGLGAGSDEPTFAAQEAVVEQFNASQDEIELVLEIIDNEVAYDTLATQIAAGNAPDIVGPVGIRGRDSFKGAWLDLQPLIDANNYDLSDFDEGMVKFYQVEDEGQLGLPFAIFPSFVLYNKELFDEAGLAYPPQEYGAPYVDADGNEVPWNYDTVADLAASLTVDANGEDATSAAFDPENIVQFGYGFQWTDMRGVGTQFSPGSLVTDDGDAQIPEAWKEAVNWVYDGMWNSYFYPNGPYGNSDILGAGNWFESGNMAMTHIHLWYVACCIGNLDAEWDFAVTPEYDGVATAKMHADTFGIMKASEHPEEAFAVLTYLLGEAAPDLLAIYGGMPARLSLQDTYFEDTWPDLDVNWEVVKAGMAHADNPNHESYMPSFQETNDKYNEYWNRWVETPDLDLDAEFDALQADLQLIFDAAEG